jgi:ABC-type glycerol-3-phosphate transport system substrate-binding protein
MKKFTTKIAAGALATMSIASVAVGGVSTITADAAGKKTINVWTSADLTPQLKEMKKLNPSFFKTYKIKQTLVSYENFQTKLDNALKTGNKVDFVGLDAGFVAKYVSSGKLADLNKYGAKKADKDSYKYTKQIGTNGSQQVALAYQSAPGAMYYRTDLLEKYLGIKADDTADATAAFSSWDKVKEAAQTIKEKSGGKAYLFSSLEEIYNPAIQGKKKAWVKNNKLVIDKGMESSLDTMKEFVSNGWVKNVDAQSADWFAGMGSDDIVAYSLPSWGLFYWLAENAKSGAVNTVGKWHVTTGPQSYAWGGTYFGAVKGSKVEKGAAQLAIYLATNKKFLTTNAKANVDFSSDPKVNAKVAKTISSEKLEILGGQNPFPIYNKAAKKIDGSTVTKYDQAIQSLWIDNVVNPYANGKVTKAKAISNFKKAVSSQYPSITVK